MAERTIKTLTCAECAGAFEQKNRFGVAPTYCSPCRPIVKARNQLRWQRDQRVKARAEANLDVTCQDCARVFQRKNLIGAPPLRCAECRVALARENARRNNLARDAASAERYAAEGRQSTCVDCGQLMTCQRFGSPFRWCPPCYDRHAAAQKKAWVEANRDKSRAISRKGQHVRRARMAQAEIEEFDESEIFERDNWKCGICGKKIDPKLRCPDPMSKSVDHIVPVVQLGGWTRANIRAAHLGCNKIRNQYGGGEQLMLINI
jgi:hypothetical protein